VAGFPSWSPPPTRAITRARSCACRKSRTVLPFASSKSSANPIALVQLPPLPSATRRTQVTRVSRRARQTFQWLSGWSTVSALRRTAKIRHRRPLSPRQTTWSPTRRACSIRISSAMLVRDRRTNSANGAFGLRARHDNNGAPAAPPWASTKLGSGAAGGRQSKILWGRVGTARYFEIRFCAAAARVNPGVTPESGHGSARV